ncbi:MAG: hypothetical protein ACREJD_02945 [Phycisphaerales bacterium]
MADDVEAGKNPAVETLIEYLTIRHEIDHYRAFISTPLGIFLDQAHIIITEYFNPLVSLASKSGPLRIPRPVVAYLDALQPAYEDGDDNSLNNSLFVLHVRVREMRMIYRFLQGGSMIEVLSRGDHFAGFLSAIKFWSDLAFPNHSFADVGQSPQSELAAFPPVALGFLEILEGLARASEYAVLVSSFPQYYQALKQHMHFGEYAVAIDRATAMLEPLCDNMHTYILSLRSILDLALYGPFIPLFPRRSTPCSWVELHPGLRFEAILAKLPTVGPLKRAADYSAWVQSICDAMVPKWMTPMAIAPSLRDAQRFGMSRLSQKIEDDRLSAARMRIQHPHAIPLYPVYRPGSSTSELVERLYPPLLIGTDGFASGTLPNDAIPEVVTVAAVISARHETLYVKECTDTKRLVDACAFGQVKDAALRHLIESQTGIAL